MLSLLEMSFTGGCLIAAVLLVRAVSIHRLPKGMLPLLWWIVLGRLLLPFRLPSPTSVYTAAHELGSRLEFSRPGILLNGAGETAQSTQAAASGFPIPGQVLLWAAVALGIALFFLITHLRGLRRCQVSLPEEDPFVLAWMAWHPLRRPVQVRCSDRIDAPFTYGLLKPVILLPKKLDREDTEKVAFVLAHELAHIRRLDALAKWLLAVCLCLHWFNPLVWVMYLLANRDLELACDEAVVRLYGQSVRADYARTLVALEEKRSHFAPLCSGFAKNALEERILAIMKHKKATAAGIAAAAVVVVVLVAVFATNAPGQNGETPSTNTSASAWNRGITQYGSAVTVEDSNIIDAYRIADWAESNTGEPAYTKKQYDAVIKGLMFDGWQDMSIAEFNRTLNAAFNDDFQDDGVSWEKSLNYAYELVYNCLPEDDKNAAYLLNTVPASRNEYQARLEEVYSGKKKDPSFSGSAQKTATADVFGEEVQIAYAYANYTFSYRILDQDGLTVAARDKFLQDMMQGAQDYLDRLTIDQIIDNQNFKKNFKAALDVVGQGSSTREIEFTGCEIQEVYGDYAGYY